MDNSDTLGLIISYCDTDSVMALYCVSVFHKLITTRVISVHSHSFCESQKRPFWDGILVRRASVSHPKNEYERLHDTSPGDYSLLHRTPEQSARIAVDNNDIEYLLTLEDQTAALDNAISKGNKEIAILLGCTNYELCRAIVECNIEALQLSGEHRLSISRSENTGGIFSSRWNATLAFNSTPTNSSYSPELKYCRSMRLALALYLGLEYGEVKVSYDAVNQFEGEHEELFSHMSRNVTWYGCD